MTDSISRITIPDIRVLFLSTTEIPGGIPALWEQLEAKFPSLNQRKFYGAEVDGNEYWASVEQTNADDAKRLGLETGTLKGGIYSTLKIPEWNLKNLPVVITAGFRELTEQNSIDPTRPFIEYYKNRHELVLMAPVK